MPQVSSGFLQLDHGDQADQVITSFIHSLNEQRILSVCAPLQVKPEHLRLRVRVPLPQVTEHLDQESHSNHVGLYSFNLIYLSHFKNSYHAGTSHSSRPNWTALTWSHWSDSISVENGSGKVEFPTWQNRLRDCLTFSFLCKQLTGQFDHSVHSDHPHSLHVRVSIEFSKQGVDKH